MADQPIPDPPGPLKCVQSYLRVAADIEKVDPVVAYWVRLFSTETSLKIDKNSPECKSFLTSLILWLEKFKQTHKDNEAVSNQTVGQAHTENFVIALFNKADTNDRNGTADKSTVRMFYMSAILFEAMEVFGPLSDEISQKAKYAKFKAAYIQRCLKSGIVPKPGPIEEPNSQDDSTQPDQSSQSSSNINNRETSKDSDTGEKSSHGGFHIPEVPTGVPGVQPKSDPFIMTPSATGPTYPSFPSPTKVPQSTSPGPSSNISPRTATISTTKFHATNGMPLNPEDIIQSQKYCKFANSALQYDDITTAVANLEKALKLLTMGIKSD